MTDDELAVRDLRVATDIQRGPQLWLADGAVWTAVVCVVAVSGAMLWGLCGWLWRMI